MLRPHRSGALSFMVYKTNIQAQHKHGDTKSVMHFAYLPHRIGDRVIWLQRYEAVYVYEMKEITGVVIDKPITFHVGAWIKASERYQW